MNDTDWNIEEVKHIKKKQLIYFNLLMLLLFFLFYFYIKNGGTPTGLIGYSSALLWILLANSVYTLLTGETIGTKSIRRTLAFDIDRIGKKRWKRQKLIEVIYFIILCIGFTVVLFTFDLSSTKLNFPIFAIPFIGGWIGTNIGQIIRIKNLS